MRASVNRHPWEQWFQNRKFTLKKGRDYTGRTDVMASQVRNYVRQKYKVSIDIAEDMKSLTVYVLADLVKRDEEERLAALERGAQGEQAPSTEEVDSEG